MPLDQLWALLIITGGIAVAILIVLVVIERFAPLGYEDSDGFHYGVPGDDAWFERTAKMWRDDPRQQGPDSNKPPVHGEAR